VFAGLSVADFLLTWWLISSTGGIVYESNPLAGWLLNRYGWLGLAAFKAVAVSAVVGSAAALCLRRRPAGEHVLTFACSATGAVVLYSCLLAAVIRHDVGALPIAAATGAPAVLR
jgi:hypothetical protein